MNQRQPSQLKVVDIQQFENCTQRLLNFFMFFLIEQKQFRLQFKKTHLTNTNAPRFSVDQSEKHPDGT